MDIQTLFTEIGGFLMSISNGILFDKLTGRGRQGTCLCAVFTDVHNMFTYTDEGEDLRIVTKAQLPSYPFTVYINHCRSWYYSSYWLCHIFYFGIQQAEIDGVLDSDGTKLYIKEKMDPWIDQRGSPLVTVTRTAPGSADVTQTQFLSPDDQITPPSQFLCVQLVLWKLIVTMCFNLHACFF